MRILGVLLLMHIGAILACSGVPASSDAQTEDAAASGAPGFGAAPPSWHPSAEGGSAGASSEGEATPSDCVDSGHDDPDDQFEDTNCDGIDGDLERAVFVAPDGDDSGPGTLASPLASIEAALAQVLGTDLDIYVCNGTYQQAVVIRQPVRIFGGYDCTDDGRRVVDRARFTSKVAIPLTIEDTVGVLLERVAFEAPDVSLEEASSVGALIKGSRSVELRRVQLESGQAGPGRAGDPGAPLTGGAPTGQAGTAACLQLLCDDYGKGGFAAAAPSCEGGLSNEVGGAGGDGGHEGVPAQAGQSSPSGAPGGMVSSELNERDGSAGANGARGAVGAPADSLIGTLDGGVYLPTNGGRTGGYGHPGQGGGGGAGVGELWQGDLCCKPGHGGSQGGFGGCGGRPGHGGSGGGASIALIISESEVTLTWTRLLSGEGGKGGSGGVGGTAQSGGAPGDVYDFQGVRLSGVGGRGGNGGPGGSGSPGGGGPSLALALWNAPLPLIEGVQVLLGLPGFGGNAAPDANGAPDGPDGLVARGYDFATHQPITF